MLYICDKTCEYFNNLRILLKRGLKPEWNRSRVRELTMLAGTDGMSQVVSLEAVKSDISFWEISLFLYIWELNKYNIT